MGFIAKLFGSQIDCESCGDRNAKASFGGTLCPNQQCQNYDSSQARSTGGGSIYTNRSGGSGASSSSQSRSRKKSKKAEVPPDFSNPISVDYINYQDEHKTFTVDPGSVREKGAHISLVVAPEGIRITLKKKKIQNVEVLERLFN